MKTLIKNILMISLLSSSAWAVMPEEQTTISPEDVPAVVPTEPVLTTETVSKIIPTDVTENTTNQEIQKRILDNSVNAVMKSEAVKNNQAVQTAQALGESLDTEVSIGNPEQGEIAHKLKLKILAFQAAAKLDYTGILKASAIYKAAENNIDLTVTEEISENSKIQVMYQSVKSLGSLNFTYDW